MAVLKEGASRPWCWSAGSWSLDLKRSGTSPLVGDDGHHKFSLIRWFMERDPGKVGAWIDSETPLDAPTLIRARFKPRQGDPPKYAQINFSFAPKMILPCDFWLEEFVEIVGEAGIMWVNQCSAAGDRALLALMSKTERLWICRNVTKAVNIPVIADAEEGYGNAMSVMDTVRDFEAAGVAGIHLDDEALPSNQVSVSSRNPSESADQHR